MIQTFLFLDSKLCKQSSDGFELKFPKLSWAELKKFQAEPSWGSSICELKPSWHNIYLEAVVKNYNQISQFCSHNMILINFMIIF